jgi:hypothetical protein
VTAKTQNADTSLHLITILVILIASGEDSGIIDSDSIQTESAEVQEIALPIFRDVTKQPVFDFVPF